MSFLKNLEDQIGSDNMNKIQQTVQQQFGGGNGQGQGQGSQGGLGGMLSSFAGGNNSSQNQNNDSNQNQGGSSNNEDRDNQQQQRNDNQDRASNESSNNSGGNSNNQSQGGLGGLMHNAENAGRNQMIDQEVNSFLTKEGIPQGADGAIDNFVNSETSKYM